MAPQQAQAAADALVDETRRSGNAPAAIPHASSPSPANQQAASKRVAQQAGVRKGNTRNGVARPANAGPKPPQSVRKPQPPIPGTVAQRFANAQNSGDQTAKRGLWRWVTTGAVATVMVASVAFAAIHFLAASDSDAIGDEPMMDAGAGAPPAKPEQIDQYKEHVAPFFTKYCADCHSGDMAEGDVNVSKMDPDEITRKGRKEWKRVLSMLQIKAMPPEDSKQPTADELAQVVGWIDDRLNNFDCKLVNDPGRVTIRRLNRAEYNNTIRDLVGVDFKPAKDFPSDDVGYGFDNIGDVLSLPPLLMEKYLDAAEQVTAKAIIRETSQTVKLRVEPGSLATDGRFAGGFVVLASAGAASANFNFPADGEYVIRVQAMGDQAGPDPARVQLQLNGRPVSTFDTKGQKKAAVFEHRMKVTKGTHRVAGAIVPFDGKPWKRGGVCQSGDL
ncbi:MAG: DUF1587 domain-containing protein, partial [Planctomycetota bacterium]|nr:DUF1587 domain-containing protein [Planctomycetota bacterium]